MRLYAFQTAEMTAEHRRSFVREVKLAVAIPKEAVNGESIGPELLRGLVQVTGEFTLYCPSSECPLRPGQMVSLKLTGPEGRFTRPRVLLTRLANVRPVSPKERAYHWEFLIPAKPDHDPDGLFRREGEAVPRPEEQPRRWTSGWNRPVLPLKPIQTIDPAAEELSLEQLLAQLGTVGTALDIPAVVFTAEGGFAPADAV